MTRRIPTPLPLLVLLAATGFQACGGESAEVASEAEVPVRDTTVPPVERRPFTATDREGLEPFNLAVELPWTVNRLRKAPVDAAPSATVLSVETVTTDAFDRVVFGFSRDAPFPGYQARLVTDATELACDPGVEASEEEPLLAVTLRPVYTDRQAAAGRGLGPVDGPHFGEAGVACASGDAVVWVARAGVAGELRVLELRDPRRLAVDLRPTGS